MATLDSESYINLILNRFFPEITEEKKKDYSYFQQNSVKVHTAGNSLATVSNMKVISEILMANLFPRFHTI
jgi:hypothetical protein